MRHCYCRISIQNKIGPHSTGGEQSSVPWICWFCNLAEECWLWWLPGWESCLYCFLRDTNTLALITIELCTQWLAGMLRLECAAARDMLVSHTVAGSKRNALKNRYQKQKSKCSEQWGIHSIHTCLCVWVCLVECNSLCVCAHPISRVFSNHNITGCSGASNKIKTILLLFVGCHSTENMNWHTHAVGDEAFPLAPPDTQSHTPNAARWVLVFSIRAVAVTLHLYSCINTFKLFFVLYFFQCSPSLQHRARCLWHKPK